MNSTSDKLAELLTAAGVFKGSESGEEFVWPPKDPKAVERLRKVSHAPHPPSSSRCHAPHVLLVAMRHLRLGLMTLHV